MPRITPLDPSKAAPEAKAVLDGVQAHLGVVPNMMKTLARSPAALQGYAAFSGALKRGRLGAPLHESIALAVAESNRCDYCLSAHALLGRKAGLSDAEVSLARRGTPSDPRTAAAVRFARKTVETRGDATDADLAALRAAGFDEGDALEIVAATALNVYTNWINHLARPDIDFPVVKAGA